MISHAAGARALGALSALACTFCLALSSQIWAAQIAVITTQGDTKLPDRYLGSSNYGNYKTLPSGVLEWDGSYEADAFKLVWDLDLDPDPFVSGSLTLTNISGVTSTYSLSVSQPVAPALPAGSIMSGLSFITLIDADFNNAASILAPAVPVGSAIFNGTIDGITQRQLFTAPYSLLATFPPGGGSAGASFSNELTTIPLTALIGITHNFTLSPGDTVTLNSRFEVVPEPGTFGLAVFAAAGVAHTVRRRKA
jgi:hypothetical protein